MKGLQFKILLLFVISISEIGISQTNQNLEKGIELFKQRAKNTIGINANAEIINEAIIILEKEVMALNDLEKSGLYYLLSLNFKARFVCTNQSEKRKILETAIKFGKVLKEKYPKNGPICFEYIVSVGLLGEISGVIKSINDGVVGKMRTNSEKLIQIDSLHNNGAGWKVLGVLNYRVPNLGIIMNWPSIENSKIILQKALKYFPNDIANNFFYAQALEKNKEIEFAKIYYNHVLKLDVRKDNLIEDTDFKLKTIYILQKL